MFRLRLAAIVAVLAVLAAACGDTQDPSADPGGQTGQDPTPAASPEPSAAESPAAGDMDGDMDDDMDMGGGYGEPADPAEADRTIEVNVDNDLKFEPDSFEVAVGEVIRFVVTNTGDVEHELVIGDEEAQQQMAEEMGSDDGDHAHSGEMTNAVTVHAGETGEITWRFTHAGTVLLGCHVPGHWEAGMRGSVVVS